MGYAKGFGYVTIAPKFILKEMSPGSSWRLIGVTDVKIRVAVAVKVSHNMVDPNFSRGLSICHSRDIEAGADRYFRELDHFQNRLPHIVAEGCLITVIDQWNSESCFDRSL